MTRARMSYRKQATNWVHDVKGTKTRNAQSVWGNRHAKESTHANNIHIIRHTSVSESVATPLIATHAATASVTFYFQMMGRYTSSSSSSSDHLVQFLLKTPPPACRIPFIKVSDKLISIIKEDLTSFTFHYLFTIYDYIYSLVYTQIIRVIN